MTSYQPPRFLRPYFWLLALSAFLLSFKVPFAFAPPASELWIVINFVLDSPHILFELLRYLVVLSVTHALICWWAYRTTLRLAGRYHFKPVVVYALVTFSLLWLLMAVLIANTSFHPLSGFDWLVPAGVRAGWGGYVAAAMWLAFAALALAWRPNPTRLRSLLLLLAAALPAFWFATGAVVTPAEPRLAEPNSASQSLTSPSSGAAKADKPNVILIGVDSFSPMHFKRYGAYIDPLWKEVEQTFIFTDTVATVPRTYPSWASILSGRYSINSGVRFNLMPRERHIDVDKMLQGRLREQGYRTVFAMDERLFANFDESFGFDEVYGPPLGAADLALAGASDHPFANLLSHVPGVGRWLFPHSFSNRAAAKSYWPDEFSAGLKKGLAKHDGRPLFLTAHFCLSHWPYFWGERFMVPAFVNARTGEPDKVKSKEPMHAASVRRVGIQISEFMQFLAEQGYLENAIVVMLSDHGEGIKSDEKIKLNPATRVGGEMSDNQFALLLNRTNASFNGHGVNVYDEWQTQVLLGFRGYGSQFEWLKPGATGRPASLIDVAPTVMDLLGLPVMDGEYDGESLVSSLRNRVAEADDGLRFRIVETDLLVRAMIDINKISVADIVKEGMGFYNVTEDGRVELKPSVIDEQLPTKVRSVYYGDWILSVSPPLQELPSMYILLNRVTGQWSENLESEFAKTAPVAEMKQALIAHYGAEFPDPRVLVPQMPVN